MQKTSHSNKCNYAVDVFRQTFKTAGLIVTNFYELMYSVTLSSMRTLEPLVDNSEFTTYSFTHHVLAADSFLQFQYYNITLMVWIKLMLRLETA